MADQPRSDDRIKADDKPLPPAPTSKPRVPPPSSERGATDAPQPLSSAESVAFDSIVCDHLTVKEIHVEEDNGMRITLPWGFISFHNNEITIASTVGDPPKLRFASVRGAGLGALSWNVLEDNQQKEVALWQGKVDERFPDKLGGETTLHLRDEAVHDPDAAMTRVTLLNSDSPEITGGGAGGGKVTGFYAQHEAVELRFQPQADPDSRGNIVVYRIPNDGSEWVYIGSILMTPKKD